MNKHLPSKTRAGISALTCVAFAAALATVLPAAAQARLPQPIYFWSNIPEPVGSSFFSNPLVIRPSRFRLGLTCCPRYWYQQLEQRYPECR
jgi:hypothetical protein